MDQNSPKFDKEETRKRMLEEAKNIRVRRSEGKYEYDNLI